MEKRELDKEFKDKDNLLRIVFVCAMWLAGFDVKCLSCLFMDKPLKAHTLMQAIARVNRMTEGKRFISQTEHITETALLESLSFPTNWLHTSCDSRLPGMLSMAQGS